MESRIRNKVYASSIWEAACDILMLFVSFNRLEMDMREFLLYSGDPPREKTNI